MVYSTRRFVLCLILCHFVLVFFSPFSITITSLGEERAYLSAFRTFVRFVLVWICRFSLPLGVWEGLRFVIVALPGLFSYLFLYCNYGWRLGYHDYYYFETLLQEGLSEPEIYGELAYKFRKFIGKTDFSVQFRKKIVTRYKMICYNTDILRQTVCLVVYPVMVDRFASLFHCTTVNRSSW